MKKITVLILLIFISLTLMISIGCSIFGGSDKDNIIIGGGRGTSKQYKIVFLKQVGTQGEIYTMNIDGTETRRLTNSPKYEDAPIWSPVPIGGVYKISFLRQTSSDTFNIFTIDSNGSNEQQITNSGVSGGMPAFWSPDGTKLLFLKSYDIYVINANGNDEEQNLTNSGTPEIFATWLSNRKIAYSGVSEENGSYDIFLGEIDSNGDFNITNLTNSDDADELFPICSPDGNKILFLKGLRTNIGGIEGPVDVWEIDISQELHTLRQLTSSGDIYESWPALYSPDGTKILFLKNGDIYVYDLNDSDSDPTNLTQSPAEPEFFPTWTPDGRILFVKYVEEENSDIFIVNPDGSDLRNLTRSRESESAPICSPAKL
jgi:TolB protein